MWNLRLLKEQERKAYIEGNLELAKLLGYIIDNHRKYSYDD